MKKNVCAMVGVVCVGGALLTSGCKSAKYKEEAKGLAAEENVAAVAVEGIPGGAVVDTLAVQAKVLDINYRKREVKLLIPGGSVVKTKVDPSAVNFDQVKKGDIINAVITEEVVFQLASSEADLKDSADVVALLSRQGGMPAGLVAAAVRVTATITAIDAEARTINLTLKDGTTKTLTVRDDIEMNQATVGDQVVIDMFEAVAISVEHVENQK
ncbi:hypothetical protein PDESU_01016 [Pontiella desulfatans]|uniref:Uncharacterized protein n=1 Tax=Pontiella desulfatans TaxID=2750659 RepID=A0A6C2TXY7_PONDE|nr:hypothetical protein [Pontiella desulfatans]VGO12463.1 hypothetical protein PDESU_01016 [Pontiella desulfatans]